MKSKHSKIIFVITFIILSAILIIFKNYYQKNIQTYKSFSSVEVELMSDKIDVSYIELKKSIKEKYTEKFLNVLNDTRRNYTNKIVEVLGEDYKTYRDELISIETSIQNKRSNFLKGEEYLSVKNEMLNLKKQLDLAKGEEKEKLEIEFQKKLSEISTLNTKLNNSLKELKEKENLVKNSLKNLFDNNKEQLISVKNQVEEQTKENLIELLTAFNFEIKELNETFGVKSNNKELPFDLNKVKDLAVSTKFENDYFNADDGPILEENLNNDNVKVEFVYENNSVGKILPSKDDNLIN